MDDPPSATRTPAKPSLDLLRSLTDEHVLRALMAQRRLTRAELATSTGLSKPTVGESVRRLTDSGFLFDTGERTVGGPGRGRVGSYYALADGIGTALAVSIAPEGVVAEVVDAYGDTLTRAERKVNTPAHPAEVSAALREAAAQATSSTGMLPRVAVASAADPVDRATGLLVELPDAPFLLGELDATAALAGFAGGPIIVDNDVNWAARTERDHALTRLDNFTYLYLGDGLGAAIVSDGEVRRGHSGLAGEVSHVVTVGPRGRAMPFTEVFAELGLRRPGSAAVDSERLLAAVDDDRDVRGALGQAIAGVITAIVAVIDPAVVVAGGSWGSHPVVGEIIADAVARLSRPVPVRAAEATNEPSLAGARAEALLRLRTQIVQAAGDAGRRAPVTPMR
jgi:predicted NBD/HSP70 family sugar kinase